MLYSRLEVFYANTLFSMLYIYKMLYMMFFYVIYVIYDVFQDILSCNK